MSTSAEPTRLTLLAGAWIRARGTQQEREVWSELGAEIEPYLRRLAWGKYRGIGQEYFPSSDKPFNDDVLDEIVLPDSVCTLVNEAWKHIFSTLLRTQGRCYDADKGSFEGWVATVAARYWISLARGASGDGEDVEDVETVVAPVVLDDRRKWLMLATERVLEDIPDLWEVITVIKDGCGTKPSQLSEGLGITVEQVRKRLARIRKLTHHLLSWDL